MTAEAKGVKTAYIDAKLVAKHDTWLAKSEAEKEVFASVSADGDGLLSIAKQMDCTNQDVVNEKCVHNDAGVLVLTHAHSMHLTIVTCYIKARETELPNNLHLFSSCLNGEYIDQNTHQSWDAGEEGVKLARQLTEAVFSCGVITSDWERSFILNLYKGRVEPFFTVATIVASSSQMKAWSCWNRY